MNLQGKPSIRVDRVQAPVRGVGTGDVDAGCELSDDGINLEWGVEVLDEVGSPLEKVDESVLFNQSEIAHITSVPP